MRKLKLVPGKPFHNSCDVVLYDMTDGEKRRAQITIEYAKADVMQLQRQGMDHAAAMDYFKGMIDSVIKYYFLSDWECVGGYEETLQIIEDHVKPYYEEA